MSALSGMGAGRVGPPRQTALLMGLSALVVVVLAWTFELGDRWQAWSDAGQEEMRLRQEFESAASQVAQLGALRASRDQVRVQVERLEQQLPSGTEMEQLMRDITQAGRQRGLQFELFKPMGVELRAGHAVVPVAIRLTGGYHDIGGFTADLARLPRIVTLHNLTLAPVAPAAAGGGSTRNLPEASRLLALEATLRTYRLLDEAEGREVAKAQAARSAAKPPAASPATPRPGGTP